MWATHFYQLISSNLFEISFFLFSLVQNVFARLLLLSECLRACALENHKKMSNRIFLLLLFLMRFEFICGDWLIARKYAISTTKKTPKLFNRTLCALIANQTVVGRLQFLSLYHQRCFCCHRRICQTLPIEHWSIPFCFSFHLFRKWHQSSSLPSHLAGMESYDNAINTVRVVQL